VKRLHHAWLAGLAVLLGTAGCAGAEPVPLGPSTAATFQDPNGDAVLERGPGEPLVDRTELAPRADLGRPLALFAQLTDTQILDEESPARLPVLDRLGAPFESSFRPQEALTANVFAAMVRSLNELRPQAVVLTGDLVDNAQANELDQVLSVLRGGRVDPASGRRRYDGPQAASGADPLFYRPDVDAPRFPGLLARAQRPLSSPGLRAPWFPLVGNHDVLAQGVARPTPRINAVARGDRALAELDEDIEVPREEARLSPEVVDRVLSGGLGRTERVPADPDRRLLDASEAARRLRAASGRGGSGPRLDAAYDIGPNLRAINLDVVSREGGSRGRVASGQEAFLRRELRRAGRRWVVVFSHNALPSLTGGESLLSALDRHPRVAAVVSGNSHRNRIAPRRTPGGGYWLVSTSSLIDYPQQSRAFRLVETAGGGAALETWMIDHTGDALADVSRQLAYVDAQGGRPERAAGSRADRNVRLFLR